MHDEKKIEDYVKTSAEKLEELGADASFLVALSGENIFLGVVSEDEENIYRMLLLALLNHPLLKTISKRLLLDMVKSEISGQSMWSEEIIKECYNFVKGENVRHLMAGTNGKGIGPIPTHPN